MMKRSGWGVAAGILVLIAILYVTYLGSVRHVSHTSGDTVVMGDEQRQSFLSSIQHAIRWGTQNENSGQSQKTHYCHLYDGSEQGNTSKIECITTKLNPPFTICLHDNAKDSVVSAYLRKHRTYEERFYEEMQQILNRDKNLHLIDIGANIGFYTLGVAKMGRKVVAVEPYIENIRRLYKSAVIDGTWEQICLVRNAMSDTRGTGMIRTHLNNQGDTRIQMKNVTCLGRSCNEQKNSGFTIGSILLDDLLEVIDFKRAIIKIDIQGYEHRAFMHALKVLDQVFIPVIFMEWVLYTKRHFKLTDPPKNEQVMIDKMIKLLYERNYRPFQTMKSSNMLDPKNWNTWPDDIVWKYHLCC